MLEYESSIPIIESLIFSSPEPLPARKIAEVLENISNGDIEEAVERLNQKYAHNDHAYRIRKIAGGYQVYIIESYARYVEELLAQRRNVRLTRSALETLAIIAYRQPVTKTDIEMIRGVASDSVIHTLLQRKLVTLAGRADTVGRPLLYKTTDEFLKFFNLNTINDLPRMEEIEELLAAKDYDSQPTLPLDADDNSLPLSDSNDEESDDLPEPDDVVDEIPIPAVDIAEESIDSAEEDISPVDDDIDDEDETLSDEVESVEEQNY